MNIFLTLGNKISELFFPSVYRNKEISHIPRAPENNIEHVFSLYDYQHPAGRELIYHIKKYQDHYVQQKIAEQMYEHLLEYISEQQSFEYFIHPIITTVPLTKKSKQARNFNQCKNIAQFLSKKLSGQYQEVFSKIRETEKQALIKNKKKRKDNMQGSFALKPNHTLEYQDVIIIDDLVTTGATLEELFKVARKNKVRNIIAITLAH